jgi:adenylate cyclase
MGTDFEAEGLLEGVEGEARAARRELLELLEREGVELEELRQAVAENRLALVPVEQALDEGGPRYTWDDVVERSGLAAEEFDRTLRALGVPRPPPGERAFSEADLAAAKRVRQVRDAGISEEAQLESARVISRSMAAVADAVTRVFGDAFLRPGDTERDLAIRYAEATRTLRPLLSAGLEYVLTVRLRERIRQAAVGAAELESGHLPDAQPVAVCFADLVGFTKLGERLPAQEVGAVAGRLEALAAEVASPPVQLVKTIGDAAMLVSPEADTLVDAALSLVESAKREANRFPRLHVGVAYGPALGRAGDWYGRPVNLASRLTDFALPGSVVATEEVREAAGDGYRWSFAGKRRFKGIRGDVAVYRVRRAA